MTSQMLLLQKPHACMLCGKIMTRRFGGGHETRLRSDLYHSECKILIIKVKKLLNDNTMSQRYRRSMITRYKNMINAGDETEVVWMQILTSL